MMRVLIPTDFSDNAWSASVYALKLFAKNECTFYFMNSYKIEASAMSNMSNKLLNVMKETAMKELLELKRMARIANSNKNHSFEIILCSENLVDAINRTIKTHNINMVVMGTKGTSKVKEIFFGSNTIKVLKKIKNSPLLIVPDEYDFIEPKQIVFPTDYNQLYDDKILNPLKEISMLYNSKIRILHIEEEDALSVKQDLNIKRLDENLSHIEHTFHWMPDYNKKTSVIQDFIEELDINILAMVSHRHSFIENIVNEPIIKKIGFHPVIPFLVLPE